MFGNDDGGSFQQYYKTQNELSLKIKTKYYIFSTTEYGLHLVYVNVYKIYTSVYTTFRYVCKVKIEPHLYRTICCFPIY
jgi:hypothetical protein